MFEQVKDLLASELMIDEAKITPTAELANDLDLTSLDLGDLVLICEERFNLEIGDKEVSGFVTVGDIVDYLSANVK